MFITCRVLDISFWKVDKYTYQIPKCKTLLKIAFSSKILLSEMKTSKRNAFCMVVKKWIFVALWHCSFVTRGSFFSQNIQSIAQNKKEIQTRIKKRVFRQYMSQRILSDTTDRKMGALPAFFIRTGSLKRNHQYENQWSKRDELDSHFDKRNISRWKWKKKS